MIHNQLWNNDQNYGYAFPYPVTNVTVIRSGLLSSLGDS